MDLLSDERLSQGLRKLWLDILADTQILELPSAQNTRYCKNISYIIPVKANLISNGHHFPSIIIFSSESDQEVLVQHYFLLDDEGQCCAAPFSWLIKMHLENLWEESEFMPGLT